MRLNSLIGLDLGLDDGLETVPELRPNLPTNDTQTDIEPKPHLWKSYERMITTFNKGLSLHRIEMSRPILWRCNYLLPSALICDTVNGFMAGTRVVRKTCSKCKRPRFNPLTLDQEITREHLIEEIMDFDNCSYSEAVTKYNLVEIEDE